jgi:hypothetical protein
MPRSPYLKFQHWILICLLLVVPLGFGTKVYSGPGSIWVNYFAGGIFYEIFWILVIVFVWPVLNPGWVAFWVFLITSILEFSQLWHPPFLETIRSSFIGSVLLGNKFSWWDFPHYIFGCLLGWILLLGIRQISTKSVTE